MRRFLEGWGRGGDVGVLATDDSGKVLGAAWARLLEEPLLCDDLGDPLPEVAIAVEAVRDDATSVVMRRSLG